MSSDDQKGKDKKIYVLKPEISKLGDEDKEEVTPRTAAFRICRCIQNIYLEIASQQDYDGANSYEDIQKSFVLREYGEMFLLRNIEDSIILDIYQHINKSDDWNKAILPMNWGYITFQQEPRVSFLLFLTSAIQSILISSSDKYEEVDPDPSSEPVSKD